MPTILRPGVIARFYQGALRAGEDECWPWINGLNGNGYGIFRVKDYWYQSHIISYMIYNNLQKVDLQVLHTCDNRRCHNPKHLFLGTNADNVKDRNAKGRQAKGETVHTAKLTKEEVLEIREKFKYKRKCSLQSDYYLHGELAKEYNVDRKTIRQIITNKIWRYLLPV